MIEKTTETTKTTKTTNPFDEETLAYLHGLAKDAAGFRDEMIYMVELPRSDPLWDNAHIYERRARSALEEVAYKIAKRVVKAFGFGSDRDLEE